MYSASVLDTMVVRSVVLGEDVVCDDKSEGSNLPLVFVFPHGSCTATTDGAQLCASTAKELFIRNLCPEIAGTAQICKIYKNNN